MNCKLRYCEQKHSAKGFCNKHYLRWHSYGDPLFIKPKKQNIYITTGEVTHINLKNRKKEIVGMAIIDRSDLNRVLEHCWCLDSVGYPTSRIDGKLVRLHRYLLNSPARKQIDHVNRNKLDNRRENLRLCTQSQNSQNNEGSKKTSKYKGVSYVRKTNQKKAKWAVYAKFPKSSKRFWGYYPTEKQAALAYNDAARLYGSDFTYLNMVPSGGTH